VKFHAGDAVMHWMHGFGTVIRLEKRSLFGRALTYYAVRVGDMIVWVPADEQLTQRLRPPTSRAQLKRLVALLAKPISPPPADRHERKLLLTEMLRDGKVESLVEVIRKLWAYRRIHALNDNDQAQLRRVEGCFLAEWGYILSLSPQQAEIEYRRVVGNLPVARPL
jgi:RNA polymerase-interacting CarD/CdnL/TRCF family regulator